MADTDSGIMSTIGITDRGMRLIANQTKVKAIASEKGRLGRGRFGVVPRDPRRRQGPG
jgi:hypothetical protein